MNRLSEMVGLYLRVNNIEYATFASECGISKSSATRFIQGKGLEMGAFVKVMAWLTAEYKERSK